MNHGIQGTSEAVGLAPATLRPARLKDTVRVLAVMVEFLKDDETRTSGDGTFGSIYPADYGAEILDPLPHDREYFRNHLTFLENYVSRASARRTVVVSRIMDSVVTVPGKIQDYSPRKGESNKAVADLAVAAWKAADAMHPGFDFSAYDMFIVFHAGRGKDIDLGSISGLTQTVFDIPSLSFTLNGFRTLYGDEFAGIPVGGGAFNISNTSILPTTNNREISLITGQRALLELTINGLLAASFGTYAGLPDLFDTKTGKTGIGRFGLMDAESIFAYGGICPPAPSAWEKVMLGWAAPRQAAAGSNVENLTAQRTDQASFPDILQVPITGNEYWLLENRHRDPAGNGQTVSMINSGVLSTQTFPKDTTGFSNESVSSLKGVIVDVEDFDWSLPGGTIQSDNKQLLNVNGGILVWHIDEAVIEQHLASNTVNADPARRGVDLEQAGGAQDIGVTRNTIFGEVTGSGSGFDYWFDGNISPVYKNSFGAATYPNTKSNDGAYSHVVMDQFSERGPLMSVRVTIGDNIIAPVSGFPFDATSILREDSVLYFVQTADVVGNREHELFVAVSSSRSLSAAGGMDTGYVLAMTLAQTPIFPATGLEAIAEPGVIQWGGAPLIGDINGDGNAEVVVYGLTSGAYRVSAYLLSDGNQDGRLDLLYSFQSRTERAIKPLISAGKLLIQISGGTEGDSLIVAGNSVEKYPYPVEASGALNCYAAFSGMSKFLHVSSNGFEVHDFKGASDQQIRAVTIPFASTPPAQGGYFNCAVSDFDGDGFDEGAALTSTGLHLASFLNDPSYYTESRTASTLPLDLFPAHISAADVDGDGRNDIIASGEKGLFVMNYALASTDYYPASVDVKYCLAARFPGQKRDALFAVGERTLSQLSTGARQADGFPVPLPRNASVTLFPAGSDTRTLAVAAIGSDGRLFVYNTPNAVDDNSFVWRSIYSGERNANYGTGKGSAAAPTSEFFPSERCYNWPNPVYEPVTKFRMYVAVDASVSIKIYDLAGDKVDELSAHAVGGTDNEIDWNVSEIQSGIYLAHIEAKSGGNTGSKIIKVAIVK